MHSNNFEESAVTMLSKNEEASLSAAYFLTGRKESVACEAEAFLTGTEVFTADLTAGLAAGFLVTLKAGMEERVDCFVAALAVFVECR